jgi:hypothetical protein
MTQELLRQLASGGLQALPPERLDDLAQWCLEWTEAIVLQAEAGDTLRPNWLPGDR